LATSLGQQIIFENRNRNEVADLIKLLQGLFPTLNFIRHPTRAGFYIVGPRSDIIEVKTIVPKLDVLSQSWTLEKPCDPNVLKTMTELFPQAVIDGDFVRFVGSPFEAEVLQNLFETGRLEIP